VRERRLGGLAIGFDGVDPKVQRRRLIQRIGQLHRLVLAELLAQTAHDPIGHIGTQRGWQAAAVDRHHLVQPRAFGIGET
jgi:hypothetical protein